MGNMKAKRAVMTEEEIDTLVAAQAEDENAWEKPVIVKRAKTASVSLPATLAERAAFFARLHREKNLETWLKRIIQERLDIEEAAFSGFKKEMLAKGSR
jgi:hypothetical protein